MNISDRVWLKKFYLAPLEMTYRNRSHSKDTNFPSQSPSRLLKSFRHQQKTKAKKHNNNNTHSNFTGQTWLVVPFKNDEDNDGDEKLPFSFQLKEFPCRLMAPRNYYKSMILVCGDPSQKGSRRRRFRKDTRQIVTKDPWMSVIERIRHALLGSFEKARNEMCLEGPVQNVPHVLFRFGKILFHDRNSSSISFEKIDRSSTLETALSQFNRSFFTNVPYSFRETIVREATQKIELVFHEEIEYYSIKVRDTHQPRNFLTCKCNVIQDGGRLELHKVEMDEERHLVTDISCLDKNLDLRLRLSSKMILTLTAGEKLSLINLLNSAVIDSKVKGGLRWPLGTKTVDRRYVVVQVCHSRTKLFRNSSMKLKIRHADRFDLKSKTGEVAKEVSLRLTKLNCMLRDPTLEVNPMVDVVCDTMKLIWDYFLY